jgi:hypothetical protein
MKWSLILILFNLLCLVQRMVFSRACDELEFGSKETGFQLIKAATGSTTNVKKLRMDLAMVALNAVIKIGVQDDIW